MICQQCTHPNADTARFCADCGQPLVTVLPPLAVGPPPLPVVVAPLPLPPQASEVMPKLLPLQVTEKGFTPANPHLKRFQAHITFKCAYANLSGRDIRAFTGVIDFQDLFGREIYKINITISNPIAAQHQTAWSGAVRFNQFAESQQRLRDARLQDMRIVWIPTAIIFTDGTRMNAT